MTNEAAADLCLAQGRKVLALIKSSFVDLAAAGADASGARNRFVGVVTRRVDAERNSEFLIDIGGGKTMTAVIPRQKAEKLKIVEGTRAAAIFEAQNVILAAD